MSAANAATYGWLVKTDEGGDAQWSKTISNDRFDGIESMIQTSDGGYALAGYTTKVTYGPEYPFYIAGSSDFWLVKTDSAGNQQWSKTYGRPEDDVAYSVVQTSDGGYALAGFTHTESADIDDFWLVKVPADAPPYTIHDYDGLLHTTDFTIKLSAEDDFTGVSQVYYRINDGATRTVTGNGQPFINTDGIDNKLEYWSVDSLGHEELPHKILTGIKLDKTSTPTPTPTPSPTVSPTPTTTPTPTPTPTATSSPTPTPAATPTPTPTPAASPSPEPSPSSSESPTPTPEPSEPPISPETLLVIVVILIVGLGIVIIWLTKRG